MGEQAIHLQLTPQQQAIVAHNRGPALVFAVAGAGKTTAIEHRIVRLVQEGIFEAPRILATTFNSRNASELRNRLARWPGCEAVSVSTLNALGHTLISEAFKLGLLPYLQKNAFETIDVASDQILSRTKMLAYERRVSFVDELDSLDREDFLNYVGKNKGNLCYANLAAMDFPTELLQLASQAEAPKNFKWYLDLYKLYEETRKALGLFTFDDQLMLGWELLASHEALRSRFQQRYDCLLVDEFQDVNKAQAELLDLLAAPHQNYMAVGDDDQTIYEWRGADPTYILNFGDRYKATVYFMTENFRCMASQVVLANAVIAHNTQRREKSLQLTRGFAGGTSLTAHESLEKMGAAMVGQIRQLQQRKVSINQMAVLVRIYAQTPPIEQQLITHNIAYEILGSVPFYMRSEVKALIAYCRLAYLEKLKMGGEPFLPVHQEQWRDCWNGIYWQPKRYIKREVAKSIAETCLRGGASLADTLAAHATQVSTSVGEKLNALAANLTWLMQAFPGGPLAAHPAQEILQELEERIGYTDYLSESSGFAETGADRAATIDAFIRYAQNQGTLLEFLSSVKKLSEQHAALEKKQQGDKLLITTIFRAKGMEWDHVFVPNCNDEIFPYKLNKNTEEERRLLYVALTRAKSWLYLEHLKEEPLSPFLVQAQVEKNLQSLQAIASASQKAPAEWNAVDLRAIAIHAPRLRLAAYLSHWWQISSEQKQAVARQIVGCYQTLQARGLFEKLGLQKEEQQRWLRLLPADHKVSTISPPGFEQWLDELEKRLHQKRTHPLKRVRKAVEATPTRDPAANARQDSASSSNHWQRGDRVTHARHGTGIITTVSSMTGEIWVKFEGAEVPRTVRKGELRKER